jgi:circadian clock protein KaiB
MEYFTTAAEAIGRATQELGPGVRYVLRLYVAGSGERSLRAVSRIKLLCEEHLPGRYELQVIDIYQQPDMAQTGDVIAAPTLVKQMPPPLRRVVGDMADSGRVLIALGVSATS